MKKQKQNISASIDAAGDSVTKEKRERNNETDKYDLNDAMNLSMNKKQRLEQEETMASTSGISTGIPNVTSTPTGNVDY